MKTVSIHDAKTNLSKYIAAAKNGEQIYIGGFGKPEVLLVKLPISESRPGQGRSFSPAAGKIVEKDGAFSPATDQNVSSLMYGE